MKQFLTSMILLFSLASVNLVSANTDDTGNAGSPSTAVPVVVESEVVESEIADSGTADPVIQRGEDAGTRSWLLATMASIAKSALENSNSEAESSDSGVAELNSAVSELLENGKLDLTRLVETTKNIDITEAVDTAFDVTERLFDWSTGSVAGSLGSQGSDAETQGLVDAGDAMAVDDPFENYNRMMFRFNQQLDEVALKPIAKHYREYTPELVRIGVRNFFSNIGDVGVLTNSALQGKFDQALSDSTRVAVNTIAGVGGVIDVATMIDIEKNHEDFGQTFGVWGIPEGPYIVLPVLGPRTLRSAVGTIADTALQVETLGALGEAAGGTDLVSEMLALNLVDRRSRLLGQTDLLEELAIDPYIFSRQAYLAYRRCQVDDCDKIDYQPAAPEVPGNNMLDELDELDELDSL